MQDDQQVNQSEDSRQKRHTNEKPVSLHPLDFDEVVRDLLDVKPPPKEPAKKSNNVHKQAHNSK